MRLQAPITLVGFTALSVEISTKESDAAPHGQFGQPASGRHYILNSFAGVVFHQRHVLVGRGVENNLGLKPVQNIADAGMIEDVGDDHGDLHAFV